MNQTINHQRLQLKLNKEVVVTLKQKQVNRNREAGMAREAFMTCCDGMSNLSTPFIRN